MSYNITHKMFNQTRETEFKDDWVFAQSSHAQIHVQVRKTSKSRGHLMSFFKSQNGDSKPLLEHGHFLHRVTYTISPDKSILL